MEELFQTRSERRERGCGWCSRRGVQVFFCLLLLDCCRCSPSTCENAVCPSPPTMTTGLVQTVEWQQGVSPSLFSLTPTSSPPTMTTGLTQTVERQQASSITTDGPTVHISQSEMTQVVTMIGVLGGVLVVLLLVAVICVPVVLGLRRKGRSIASNPITSTGVTEDSYKPPPPPPEELEPEELESKKREREENARSAGAINPHTSQGFPEEGEPEKAESKEGEPEKAESKEGEPEKAESKEGEPEKAELEEGEPVHSPVQARLNLITMTKELVASP